LGNSKRIAVDGAQLLSETPLRKMTRQRPTAQRRFVRTDGHLLPPGHCQLRPEGNRLLARQKSKEGTMRTLLTILTALAAIALAGCATLPPPDEMRADVAGFELPKMPEADKAIVYVVRPSGLGGIVRFNVFVDDQEPESEMGYTRGSQYIYFNLLPGDHQILSKAENWAEINVTASPGNIIYVQQEPSMGVIMARNTLIKIQDYEAKYHIKRLELGTIKKMDK
jgi:hypothetical protein